MKKYISYFEYNKINKEKSYKSFFEKYEKRLYEADFSNDVIATKIVKNLISNFQNQYGNFEYDDNDVASIINIVRQGKGKFYEDNNNIVSYANKVIEDYFTKKGSIVKQKSQPENNTTEQQTNSQNNSSTQSKDFIIEKIKSAIKKVFSKIKSPEANELMNKYMNDEKCLNDIYEASKEVVIGKAKVNIKESIKLSENLDTMIMPYVQNYFFDKNGSLKKVPGYDSNNETQQTSNKETDVINQPTTKEVVTPETKEPELTTKQPKNNEVVVVKSDNTSQDKETGLTVPEQKETSLTVSDSKNTELVTTNAEKDNNVKDSEPEEVKPDDKNNDGQDNVNQQEDEDLLKGLQNVKALTNSELKSLLSGNGYKNGVNNMKQAIETNGYVFNFKLAGNKNVIDDISISNTTSKNKGTKK